MWNTTDWWWILTGWRDTYIAVIRSVKNNQNSQGSIKSRFCIISLLFWFVMLQQTWSEESGCSRCVCSIHNKLVHIPFISNFVFLVSFILRIITIMVLERNTLSSPIFLYQKMHPTNNWSDHKYSLECSVWFECYFLLHSQWYLLNIFRSSYKLQVAFMTFLMSSTFNSCNSQVWQVIK